MSISSAIRIRAVTKHFGDVIALDGVDLDTPTGQVHGLVGPNGAGKTTLLGMLLGLTALISGEGHVLGHRLARTRAVPAGVAGFLDGPGLYPTLTARQNLVSSLTLAGARINDDAVDEILDTVGLSNVAHERVRGFSLTISHSKYWKDSAIFVVEDDSQNGADHIDGHRAPVQVISPWARHGAVVNTYYSQLNMVRTIEQILGAQPLNQKLAAATPMYDAFQKKADTTPYNAVPNQVPLTEGVAPPPACGLDTLGKTGAAAAKVNATAAKKTAVPASMKAIAAQWATWSENQQFTGRSARGDYANPAQMNRWTWYQTHNWSKPYPGDSKIYSPKTVPGGAIPSTSDGD